MTIAVEVDNLIKSYGSTRVIKDISFKVNQGEILALLGTNGAGKTTTLECIEGLRKYDSGSITVNGTVGVQLQSSSLPENIKALEAFKLFSKWNKAKYDEDLVKAFHLNELSKKQYKQLSTGQKRRLHLALALIGDPEIIFLDEPTSGLDVEGRVSLHEQIRLLKKRGKTIIMASHDMAEVENLCDRIAIIKGGQFAFVGTSNELTREMGQHARIHIKTSTPIKKTEFKDSTHQGYIKGYNLFLVYNIGDFLYDMTTYIKGTKNIITDLKVEKASLEQRFMDIAKEKSI